MGIGLLRLKPHARAFNTTGSIAGVESRRGVDAQTDVGGGVGAIIIEVRIINRITNGHRNGGILHRKMLDTEEPHIPHQRRLIRKVVLLRGLDAVVQYVLHMLISHRRALSRAPLVKRFLLNVEIGVSLLKFAFVLLEVIDQGLRSAHPEQLRLVLELLDVIGIAAFQGLLQRTPDTGTDGGGINVPFLDQLFDRIEGLVGDSSTMKMFRRDRLLHRTDAVVVGSKIAILRISNVVDSLLRKEHFRPVDLLLSFLKHLGHDW